MIPPIGYCRPASVADVVAIMRDDDQALPLAGGQSLLSAMKLGLTVPTMLIDLAGIAGLDRITLTNSGNLRIGAMATHHQIATSPVVHEHVPGLAQLAAGIGDAQIRRRGTIGGSLSNNDPAACWPAALLALDARVQTDRREIPADAFVGTLFETALEPAELVIAVEFSLRRSFVYLKIEQPASRFALAGLAIGRHAGQTRVAATGIADKAVRLLTLERALESQFHESALPDTVLDDIAWLDDLHAGGDYRRHLCARLARRAVQRLNNH